MEFLNTVSVTFPVVLKLVSRQSAAHVLGWPQPWGAMPAALPRALRPISAYWSLSSALWLCVVGFYLVFLCLNGHTETHPLHTSEYTFTKQHKRQAERIVFLFQICKLFLFPSSALCRQHFFDRQNGHWEFKVFNIYKPSYKSAPYYNLLIHSAIQ